MYSMLEALELFNSEPRTRNGFPSTINCVAVPCFAKCGMPVDGFACEKAAVDASNIKVVVTTRVLSFIIF
jgi:hypothetical protein